MVGFGGHALSIADSIMQSKKYELVGYTDVSDRGNCYGAPWLGEDDALEEIHQKGCENAFIGIGFMGKSDLRDLLFRKLIDFGYSIPVVCDKTAAVGLDVETGSGTFIGKNAVVNAGSRIGDMCIINSGSIVEHENNIGDFSHIAVGAVLCGNVTIGDHCLLGGRSVVMQGVKIGSHCIVGAGSTVLKDVPDNTTVYGLWKGLV